MMSVTTLLGCRRQNPRAWQYSTCSSTALATTEARARPRRTAVALTTGAGDVITAVAMAEGRYSAVVGAHYCICQTFPEAVMRAWLAGKAATAVPEAQEASPGECLINTVLSDADLLCVFRRLTPQELAQCKVRRDSLT